MNDIDAEISKLDGMIKSRVNELENQIKRLAEEIIEKEESGGEKLG